MPSVFHERRRRILDYNSMHKFAPCELYQVENELEDRLEENSKLPKLQWS